MLIRPVIRYFAESVFAEDRRAVEAEQRAYDEQGADWNQEVVPLIVELRALLRQTGAPPIDAPAASASASTNGDR